MYRASADQITVSAALYCPQRPDSQLVQIGNVPAGKGWFFAGGQSEQRSNDIVFLEEVYSRGSSQKLTWTSYFVADKWLANRRVVRLETALDRLKNGASAGEKSYLKVGYREENKP